MIHFGLSVLILHEHVREEMGANAANFVQAVKTIDGVGDEIILFPRSFIVRVSGTRPVSDFEDQLTVALAVSYGFKKVILSGRRDRDLYA